MPSPASIAARRSGIEASPSPLSTQSIAPALDERGRGERGAVPADADEDLGKTGPRGLCEIDDLRNVGEVVAREGDDIGPPATQQAKISAMVLDLQIDQPRLVPGAPRRLGDELEPERLEPQKDPGV